MTTNTDVKLSTSQDVTNTLDNNVESDMKNHKNLKAATNNVEVNNMNELTTTINNAVKDSEYDEYIINLNEGTYQITANVNYNAGNCTPNIIINANNQTFTGSDNIITDNYLKSFDKYADESVNLNGQTNTIANNTPKYELIIETTTFTIGQTANITASIQFDGEILSDINSGKVAFKVNGKTLKDANGKVIYAKSSKRTSNYRKL